MFTFKRGLPNRRSERSVKKSRPKKRKRKTACCLKPRYFYKPNREKEITTEEISNRDISNTTTIHDKNIQNEVTKQGEQ